MELVYESLVSNYFDTYQDRRMRGEKHEDILEELRHEATSESQETTKEIESWVTGDSEDLMAEFDLDAIGRELAAMSEEGLV